MNRVFGLARNFGVWFWQEEEKDRECSWPYTFVKYRRFLFKVWLAISLFWFAYFLYKVASLNPLVILQGAVFSLLLSAACTLTIFMVWRTAWGIWELASILFDGIKRAIKVFMGLSLKEKIFFSVFIVFFFWFSWTMVNIIDGLISSIPIFSGLRSY